MWPFDKKADEKVKEKPSSIYNTFEENKLLCKIDTSQQNAEAGVRPEMERMWSDEDKMHIGKQWDTSVAKRSKEGKERNFNSQDNFIHPTVQNIKDSLTGSMPETVFEGVEPLDDIAAEKITGLVADIKRKNSFEEQWDKMILQMIKHGMLIGSVLWDQHWIGGSGPNRWVGEVTTLYVKKEEFFPDPAILDLEERLQECDFINIKKRKKLNYFKDVWKERGKLVIMDSEKIIKGQENEGPDPDQATLIIHRHKGVPKFVSEEWKQKFLDKAEEADREGLPFKAQDYRDMAAGILKGVHCAYKAGTIILDYIPYEFEDGLYPFVYKVLYADSEQPWGMGEVRNLLMPQANYNKADEIELGAMLSEGLGGWIYDKGSMTESQKQTALANSSKPNVFLEVMNKNGMQQRTGTRVPQNIGLYRDKKQGVIDVVSRNTAIRQGILPSANVSAAALQELGSRSDIGTIAKVKVLKRFYLEFAKLIVNRIVQFYTEERSYRILGDNSEAAEQQQVYQALMQIANAPAGTPPQEQMQAMVDILTHIKSKQKQKTGTFSKRDLVRTWDREVIKDEKGNVVEKRKEEFIPELDIKVKIDSERPTDRNYFTNLAMALLNKGLGLRAFWYTMENGKFPPIKEIIEEIQGDMQKQAEAAEAEKQAIADQQAGQLNHSIQKEDMKNKAKTEQIALKGLLDRVKQNG